MIEYIIQKEKADLKFVRELWERFFIDDPIWHFNFYDGFIRLKLAKSYQKLDDHINNKGWRWEKNPYNQGTETMPVMQRNFNEFMGIFHGYTMLIMKEKDQSDIEGRITHIYFNMRKMEYDEEARTLAKHALSRAKLDGWYEGFKKSKGYD